MVSTTRRRGPDRAGARIWSSHLTERTEMTRVTEKIQNRTIRIRAELQIYRVAFWSKTVDMWPPVDCSRCVCILSTRIIQPLASRVSLSPHRGKKKKTPSVSLRTKSPSSFKFFFFLFFFSSTAPDVIQVCAGVQSEVTAISPLPLAQQSARVQEARSWVQQIGLWETVLTAKCNTFRRISVRAKGF